MKQDAHCEDTSISSSLETPAFNLTTATLNPEHHGTDVELLSSNVSVTEVASIQVRDSAEGSLFGANQSDLSDAASLHSVYSIDESADISVSLSEQSHLSSDSESDTDSILCDPDCYVAHYLDEAPALAPNFDDAVRRNLDDPDDPGDSEGSADEDEDSSAESEDDYDGDFAQYATEELNVRAALVDNFTKGQLILVQLAAASAHNKTFECLLDDFRNMNLLLGKNWLPESKSKLFASIHLDRGAAQFHAYCGRPECGSYIGRKNRLPGIVRCRTCNHTTPISKAHFFVMLNFRKQLEALLRTPGIWEKLQYRHNRVKVSPTAVEDVYDGSRYKEMRSPGGPLESEFNFSYVFNTDGFKRFNTKSKLKVWPLFARINELPPAMRQRFTCLVGLYVDMHDPNFQSFLKPFVKEANRLSSVGIRWKPDSANEVVSRFVCFCHGVDAVARSAIHEMNTVTGYFGCTYCLQEGVRLAGCQRFSFLDDLGNYAEVEDRSHEGMVEDMLASRNGDFVRGHKGLSQLLLLRHFDLRLAQSHDDLHQDHEGCAKDLTERLLINAPRVGGERVTDIDVIRAIDRRLLPIKTPSIMSRKPLPIGKRGSYKGSEWRNWLLYFSVPCLIGIIQPAYVNLMAHLSHACYLTSQDVIEEEDIIVQAEEGNLRTLGQGFEERFGLDKVKYNLHATVRHKCKSVRTLGPPWNSSTYNFESLNSKIGPMITSPQGAMMQVVTRCFLNLTVNLALFDETLPDPVKRRLKDITSKLKLKRARQVGVHTYAVGTAERRPTTPLEVEVMGRENLRVLQVYEYPYVVRGRILCKSIYHQNESKSDDSFIYTTEDTFCTIHRALVFTSDDGEEHCGVIVWEHDVARSLDIATHISVLRRNDADLMHYIDISKVRCPAIKFNIDDLIYAVPVANCLEID